MNWRTVFLGFAFFTAVFRVYPQMPPAWWINPPEDTTEVTYATGVSDPVALQSAVAAARRDAINDLAEKVCSFIWGRTDISITAHNTDGSFKTTVVDVKKNSSITVRLELNNIKEVRREITDLKNGTYIAYLLVGIGAEDLRSARNYARHESESFDIYNLLMKNAAEFSPPGITEAPQGFLDFSSWLEHSCITASITGNKREDFLDQTAEFLRKCFRRITMALADLDGEPVLIIDDAPVLGEEIVQILRQSGQFSLVRKNFHLVLTPVVTLKNFKEFTESKKGASKILIAGIEIVHQALGKQRVVVNNTLEAEFLRLAKEKLGMEPEAFSLTSDTNEQAVIAAIRKSGENLSARYALVYFAETFVQSGIPQYKLPESLMAKCRVILYDFLTGKTLYSKTVNSGGFIPVTQGETDENYFNKSLQTLGFFKNGSRLTEIMEEVLER
jgi:hypothetical protein